MSLGEQLTSAISGNPMAQLNQALNPSMPGPVPGQGGPSAPPMTGGQPGAPQQPPMAPPQATQSPPDLANLYMRLYQQERGAQMFDQGLSGLQAAFAPPGQQAAWLAHGQQGGRQDPGQMLQNLMQMQYMQKLQNLPAPTGAGSDIANIWPSLPPDAKLKYYENEAHSQQQVAQQGAEEKQKDFTEARNALPEQSRVLGDLNTGINEIKTAANPDGTNALQSIISSPAKRAVAQSIIDSKADPDSVAGSLWQSWKLSGMSDQEITTIMNMKRLTAQTYAEALPALKGSRKTQAEIQGVAAGLNQIKNLNQPFDDGKGGGYLPALNKFQDQTKTTLANAYGAAGQLDAIPNEFRFGSNGKPYVNEEYHPGGPLYNGTGGEWVKQSPQPATIQSPGDIAKLARGTPFMIPDGPNKGKIGYAQ